MKCSLEYIPERLHSNEKPVIDVFDIGEKLYYRCKQGECKKPYDNIPLTDISHNRDFSNSDDYPLEDVFFNIIESDSNEKYDGLSAVTLEIKNLGNSTTYIKEIKSINNPDIKVIITLKHDPVPCMYPHSVFEISLDNTIVTRSNWKKTLGKDNRTFKNLRTDVRQELTSMIQSQMIDSSNDTEIIDEL